MDHQQYLDENATNNLDVPVPDIDNEDPVIN